MEKSSPFEIKEEDAEKIFTHLKDKWGNEKQCPMCGADNWVFGSKMVELREYRGGDLIIGNTVVFPLVPIICTNCGNTFLLNAFIIGILERIGKSKDE